MKREYKVIAEGSFDHVSQIIPAIAFIGHVRDKKFRATIIIEELEDEENTELI